METAGSTEMCVLFYQNTWHHITEDGSLQRMNILLLLLQCVYDLHWLLHSQQVGTDTLLCFQYVVSGWSRRMEHWHTDCRLRKVSNRVTCCCCCCCCCCRHCCCRHHCCCRRHRCCCCCCCCWCCCHRLCHHSASHVLYIHQIHTRFNKPIGFWICYHIIQKYTLYMPYWSICHSDKEYIQYDECIHLA